MSKKKILIVNNNMHIGGVQRALVNLLKCVHDKYDVTLMLFYPGGELMGEIPADVRVIPVKSAYRYLGMTKHDVHGRKAAKILRSFFAAVCRIAGRKTAVSLMALTQKRISGYDAAISYLHDAGDKMFYGGCNDFVLRHADAAKKIGFLHCDYMGCGANTARNAKKYPRFDVVAACSDGCRNAFLKALPEMAARTTTVPNCQDYGAIRRLSGETKAVFPSDRVNVLTVARLGREKGVVRAIEAIAKMENAGAFHYYIIGDGAQRREVEELVEKYSLNDRVTLLGEMSNPYAHMKAADLLLMPSVNEAAPMVIGEAACLGTPVLTTLTTSAVEMVEKTGFGWICENSVDGISAALEGLLKDRQAIEEKTRTLADAEFNNDVAVAQFEMLIEGAPCADRRDTVKE